MTNISSGIGSSVGIPVSGGSSHEGSVSEVSSKTDTTSVELSEGPDGIDKDGSYHSTSSAAAVTSLPSGGTAYQAALQELQARKDAGLISDTELQLMDVLQESSSAFEAGSISQIAAHYSSGRLSASQTLRLINLAATNGYCSFHDITSLMQSPFVAQASPEQIEQLIEVAEHCYDGVVIADDANIGRGDTNAFAALADLASQQLNGKPRLLDESHSGSTLLQELHNAATTSPEDVVLTESGKTHEQILSGMIMEIADSGKIAQGNMGTCGATSLQIMLVEQNPAEYARLCNGLLTSGSVNMRNGEALVRDSNTIVPTPGNCRTPTERLFQSAIMEYGSPLDYRVENKTIDTKYGTYTVPVDGHEGSFLSRLPVWMQVVSWILVLPAIIMSLFDAGGGLLYWEWDKCAEAVFGEDFKVSIATDRSMDQLYRATDGNLDETQVAAGMRFFGQGFHYVQVAHVDAPDANPRSVTIHNPWGSAPRDEDYDGDLIPDYPNPGDPLMVWDSDSKSYQPLHPEVTWADPDLGTLNMPYDLFKGHIIGLQYPDSAVAFVQGESD